MINQHGDKLHDVASRVTTDGALAVAFLNIFLGLTVQEWCLVIGTVCGVGTMVVNWWYRRKQDRRDAKIASVQHGIAEE